jgi:ribosome-associated heat shock protein Hsp15
MDGLRLDKWLWAARFYKTRSLAQSEVERGRVRVNGLPAKPARELHVGDQVAILGGSAAAREVRVLALSERRGPAAAAQALYEETEQSLASREQSQRQQALAPEPALARSGRPTKRERRDLDSITLRFAEPQRYDW